MALFVPKKDGGPNINFFRSSEILEEFEQVCKWLQNNCEKYVQSDPPTKESLSELLISFIQFQETHFGKWASEPPAMRLPNRCFLDFKPGGSLCYIFYTIYRYKLDQSCGKVEFRTESEKNGIEIAFAITQKLIEQKCIRLPNTFIRPEVDENLRQKVTNFLKARQCKITEHENQATHIIYPETDLLPDEQDEYARPSFKQGNNIMMHWYNLPESYDSWMPNTANTLDLPGDVSENFCRAEREIWRVTSSWVLHSQEFNEWMSEEDYEVDENGKKMFHLHALSIEILMQTSAFSKRAVKPKSNKNRSVKSSAVEQKNVRKCSVTSKRSVKPESKKSTSVKSSAVEQKNVRRNALPTTRCPICKISITAKCLARHQRETHSTIKPEFKCSMCDFVSKRHSQLLDHQRRQHLEPTTFGRPKKNETRTKRTPFKVQEFYERHASSMAINTSLKKNLEELKGVINANDDRLVGFGQKLLDFEKGMEQALEQKDGRVSELEKVIQKKDKELQALKIRLEILEKKQKKEALPNLKDIKSLLHYLNLSENATSDEIRTTINSRILEVSPESMVNSAVTENMTEDEKEDMTSFLNQASDILQKWISNSSK